MTATTPNLVRPALSVLTLRNGTRALRVNAADQSILITERHIAGFLDDLDDALDGMEGAN